MYKLNVIGIAEVFVLIRCLYNEKKGGGGGENQIWQISTLKCLYQYFYFHCKNVYVYVWVISVAIYENWMIIKFVAVTLRNQFCSLCAWLVQWILSKSSVLFTMGAIVVLTCSLNGIYPKLKLWEIFIQVLKHLL